jgi:Spy/CpxP family protein refolding chaperone
MTQTGRSALVLAVCLVAGLTLPGQAAPGPQERQMVPVSEILKLSPAQEVKFDALQKSQHDRTQALRAAGQTQQQLITKLYTDDRTTEATLQAAYNKLNAIRGEILAARSKNMVAIRTLLTPAQRQIMAERHPLGEDGMTPPAGRGQGRRPR